MKIKIAIDCPHCPKRITLDVEYDTVDPTRDCFTVRNCPKCAKRIAVNMIYKPEPEIYAETDGRSWSIT